MATIEFRPGGWSDPRPARGPLDDHGGVWDGPEPRAAIREHELRVAWRRGLEAGLTIGALVAIVLVAAIAVAAWS